MSTANQLSDATKSMFEEMVKKVIMDMVSDDDSSIFTIKTSVSSKKELNPVKAERRRSSRRDRSKSSHVKKEEKLITDNDCDTTIKSKSKKKKGTSEEKKRRKDKAKDRRARKSSIRMGEVLKDLYDLKNISDDSDDSTNGTLPTSSIHSVSVSSSITSEGSIISKPGTTKFYQEMTSKLRPHRNSLCIQDASKYEDTSDYHGHSSEAVSQVNDFEAAFEPNEMRCLALVSHNEMKATMKDFVIKYKNVLKKFRLTGTQSTMKMLGEVFEGDDSVVFGPACSSGPLGGDAELVAMMASGNLGGILFFQDPMTSHPHQCDIECLVRQALVHNTLIATTPTTAMAIMEVFKMALMGTGRPELVPSFFFSLQSPTVEAYKNNQKNIIASRSA